MYTKTYRNIYENEKYMSKYRTCCTISSCPYIPPHLETERRGRDMQKHTHHTSTRTLAETGFRV